MSFLIPTALAANTAAAGAAHQQNPIMGTVMMLVIFAVFIYFLMWRPQSKRAKQHRTLLASLQNGDEIVTTGGLLGKIIKVEDAFIVLKIAENAEVKIQKPAISSVLPKGTVKF